MELGRNAHRLLQRVGRGGQVSHGHGVWSNDIRLPFHFHVFSSISLVGHLGPDRAETAAYTGLSSPRHQTQALLMGCSPACAADRLQGAARRGLSAERLCTANRPSHTCHPPQRRGISHKPALRSTALAFGKMTQLRVCLKPPALSNPSPPTPCTLANG